MRERIIKILLREEAKEFILLQPAKAQEKITYNLRKLQSGIMDKDLFKKLEGSEIWELRTLFNGICYRLFAFWDTTKGALVVATHGTKKKTTKTPQKEIQRAERMRQDYFKEER